MRHCFNIDYPVRKDYNAQGVQVALISLPPVKCTTPPVLRSSVVWADGTKQHTYTCDAHANKLRTTTTEAGFAWDPHPYSPSK